MKKTVLVFSIIGTVLILVLAGCQLIGVSGEEEKDSLILSEELFQDNDYNLDFRDFTLAVGLALRTSPDFRKVVKDEALKQFDGDYDVLLTRVKDKKVKAPVMYKSAGEAYTVKDLLNDSFSSEGRMRLNKSSSTSSVIDELSEKYPDMQIAVPVHAEEWDEENYIPTVTFLPSEFNDATTTTLTGYDAEGNMVPIDVLNEPDDPVIVIGENERSYAINEEPIIPIEVLVPTNLSGMHTESGIRLYWEMISEASPENVMGYYIFRKSVNTSTYTLVQTIPGVYNRSFDDNYVIAGASYSYYVMSYYQASTSPPSNYINITAPLKPKPIVSFEAKQYAKDLALLSWNNESDQSSLITGVNIYKSIVGISDFDLLKSFPNNQWNYYDNDVPSGEHIIYRIHNVSDLGESEPKYDFIDVPYRDISKVSPVYIKQIIYSDERLEPWPKGAPEFYVTVTNVDPSTKKTYVVQNNMDLRFNFWCKGGVSQEFKGYNVIKWKPGYWYDMLTFTVLEYDHLTIEMKLELSAGYASKDKDTKALTISGGLDCEVIYQNTAENCGNQTLGYYENPEQWLEFPGFGLKMRVSETDDNFDKKEWVEVYE